jgi:para-nitrobenzyl esterase
MKRILVVIALNVCAIVLSFAQTPYGFPVRATIANGVVEGTYDTKSGLQIFLGVPYAKPPVGELRWKVPQPLDNWKGIYPAKSFANGPVQGLVFGDMRFRSPGVSEDCLYLNVWSPAKPKSELLPVLVYFYGGGFVAGDGSEPRYDGASMAKKGIVVVTVNYRLNIFGFFAHPELSKEASYKGSGNYGLLDQHAALKWVQQNITAFGGDPKKVTIAGESAGSISVSAQMASPLSRSLIAGAIGESGAAIPPTLPPVPLAEAEKIGLEFATKAGYPTLAQLRALSTFELFELYNQSRRFGFPLVVDGYFFPKTVTEIFNTKQQAQVPLLLGWNSAEFPAAAFMQGRSFTPENFIARVKETYPDNSEEVLKLYPHNTEQDIELSATALASDRFISYSTWKWFDLHRKNSSRPVYRYLYNKSRPPLVDQTKVSGLAGGTMDKPKEAPAERRPVGAPHACEIEYCMGNLYLAHEYAWTADDYKVSEVMQNYFANFIKTGSPNGDNLLNWPSAEAKDDTPPVMVIDVESKASEARDDARYLFHDKWYQNN